jgi:hypothetical protein
MHLLMLQDAVSLTWCDQTVKTENFRLVADSRPGHSDGTFASQEQRNRTGSVHPLASANGPSNNYSRALLNLL